MESSEPEEEWALTEETDRVPLLEKLKNAQAAHDSLRDTVRHGVVENNRLKNENTALSSQLSRIKVPDPSLSLRVPFRHPPIEILSIIFDFALPSPALLDSALFCGPESGWSHALRTKKSIIGVCWTWYKAGVNILYEDIVIRRCGQISALRRTLDTYPEFCVFVKSLRMSCFVPNSFFPVFQADLQDVIDQCPRLSSLAFDAPINLPNQYTPLPVTFHNTSLNITRLDCGIMVDFNGLAPELAHFSDSLVSLSFFIPSLPPIIPVWTKISLPQLESLTCYAETFEDLPSLGKQLVVPNLTSLTLKHPSITPTAGLSTEQFARLFEFFQLHGSGLKFLQLNYHLDVGSPSEQEIETPWFQHTIQLSPYLEHLVLLDVSLGRFSHPKLLWLDLWDFIFGEASVLVWREDFPSLLGVRLLDYALIYLIDLPRIIPPSSQAGTFEIRQDSFIQCRPRDAHDVDDIADVYRSDANNLHNPTLPGVSDESDTSSSSESEGSFTSDSCFTLDDGVDEELYGGH